MRITYDRNRADGVLTPSDGGVVFCAAEEGECGFGGLHRTATLTFRNTQPMDYRMYEVSADGSEILLFDTVRLEDRSYLFLQDGMSWPPVVKLRVPYVDRDARFIRNSRLEVAFDSIAKGRFDSYVQREVRLNGAPLQVAADGTFDLHTQPFDDRNQISDNVLTFARRPDEDCTVFSSAGQQVVTVGENSIELRLRSPLRVSDQIYGFRTVRELTITLRCSTGDGGVDAGEPDAGTMFLDGGVDDGGGLVDAGGFDAGPPDAGTPDAGTLDAGAPDSGTPDAGLPDAGPVDAGVPPQLACAPAVYMTTSFDLGSTDTIYRHRPNGSVELDFTVPTTVRVVSLKRATGAAIAMLSLSTGVVQIFDGSGALVTSFSPLSGNAGAIAACDFDLDGDDDVLVGTKQGAQAQYEVALADGTQLQPVTAIANHTRALSVACGDVEGTGGSPQVIIGPGFSADNSVRVFTWQGGVLNTFQPYGSSHWDGVEVAVARLSPTGPERIVTTQRTFAPTQVRVFTSGGTLLASRDVFDATYTSGSSVSAADLNADGLDEIVVSQLTSVQVRVLSPQLDPVSGWLNNGFLGVGAVVSATPRAAQGCPTVQPDAGVDAGIDAGVDAGTQSPRDAGAGCTAEEGHQLFKLPQPYLDLYTRVEQHDGYAWFTESGGGGYASVWKVPLDGGQGSPVANAVQEPTGLVVNATDVFFTDKGNFGQLNGRLKHLPLDGGQPVETNMLDFPIDVALVSTDAGQALVWITAGNTRLNRSDFEGTVLASTNTLSSPTVMTTDETHVYYANLNRVVERFPLDFTNTTQATTIAHAQTVPLDPVYAMQVVGDDLFILHSAGSPNARTRITRIARDGSGGPVLVANVNGVQSRAMQIVNGWIYVAEGSYAPGCSAYRIWRVPVTSVQASTVETVANSPVPFSDFSIGPDWLVMLRDAVWAAPAP